MTALELHTIPKVKYCKSLVNIRSVRWDEVGAYLILTRLSGFI